MGTKVRFVHGKGICAAIYSSYDPHPGGASAKTVQSTTAEHVYEVPRRRRRRQRITLSVRRHGAGGALRQCPAACAELARRAASALRMRALAVAVLRESIAPFVRGHVNASP